jgi:hypothetical protein
MARQCWPRTTFGAATLLLPLILAGCTVSIPTRQYSITLKPTGWVIGYQIQSWRHTAPYCGPASYLGVGPDSPSEVMAGYARYNDPGTGPFPCGVGWSLVYRGAVVFDLTPITRLPRKIVYRATLSFTSRSEFRRDTGGPVSTAVDCLRDVQRADVDPFRYRGLFPATPFEREPSMRINDVTPIVQSWVVRTAPNYGFVFVGRDESFPYNNGMCVANINARDAQLIVTYYA